MSYLDILPKVLNMLLKIKKHIMIFIGLLKIK
nr:MAG TPA: hypothetical protein [Bacteriophage sp.]